MVAAVALVCKEKKYGIMKSKVSVKYIGTG